MLQIGVPHDTSGSALPANGPTRVPLTALCHNAPQHTADDASDTPEGEALLPVADRGMRIS